MYYQQRLTRPCALARTWAGRGVASLLLVALAPAAGAFQLTIQVSGVGNTNPPPGVYTYSSVQTVTVAGVIQLGSGWTLLGWTASPGPYYPVGCAIDVVKAVQVTVDKDQLLTAIFVQNTTGSTWIGEYGTWSLQENWCVGLAPNNILGTRFIVSIPDGSPALDLSPVVQGLTLSSGAALRVPPFTSHSLTVLGTFSSAGTLRVETEGHLTLVEPNLVQTSAGALEANDGEIRVDGGSMNGGTLRTSQLGTIELAGGTALVNGLDVQNDGVLRASGLGTLTIETDIFGTGTLKATDGGEVKLRNSNVSNHSLLACGGTILLDHAAVLLEDGGDFPPPCTGVGETRLELIDSTLDGTDGLFLRGGTALLSSGSTVTISAGPLLLCPETPLVAPSGLQVLDAESALAAGSFEMCAAGELNVAGTLTLAGALTFSNVLEAEWNWAPTARLVLNGGTGLPDGNPLGYAPLEIGGRDLGIDSEHHVGAPAGFVQNFSVPELVIGPGAHVNLVDYRDNGHRDGPGGASEALYVDTLQFADNAGRLNLNGRHLYFQTLLGDHAGQIVNMPSADFDSDGDLDGADLNSLAACMAGPGITNCPTGCDPSIRLASDVDGDLDVDVVDYGRLQPRAPGAGGVYAKYVARWDGSSWHRLGSGMNDWVRALAVLPNGDLVAGGDFTMAGGGSANYIARWDGSSWYALDSGVNNWVMALAVLPNGDLVAGGDFTMAGNASANFIARWDGMSWHPLGSGMNSGVRALTVLPNGNLVAGGSFTVAGNVSANHIARWDGSSWHALDGGVDNWVGALAVLPDSDVVAGGGFTTAGEVSAGRIARWESPSWFALGSGMNDYVCVLTTLPNGDLVAGGWFTTAGGVGANYIARWDGSSWHQFGSSGMNDWVYVLAGLSNGHIIAGGHFTTAGGVRVNYIARWDGTHWFGLQSGMNGYVWALVVLPNGDLVAGGEFATAGGQPAVCRGDTNCDGSVSFADINPFVQALGNLSKWQIQYPSCPWQNCDINGDGNVNFADINPFVAKLGSLGSCP